MNIVLKWTLSLLFFIPVITVNAQERDLVSFGNFTGGAPNEIGGVDTYVISCTEREFLCSDNFTNMWVFGETLFDYRVKMCELSFDVVSQHCVHTIEINFQLAQPYADSVLEIQRPNCGRQEIFVDGDFFGSIRADQSGITPRINIEFALGMLLPGRPHVVLITAPENDDGKCAPPIQAINVTGIAVKGTPVSNR